MGDTPMYTKKEEVQILIDTYFEDCKKEKKPMTTTGLALALGFTTRQALLNYEGKPEFVDTIKKAKSRIEERNEQILYSRKVPTAGVIFNLTNNHRWKNELHTNVIERELDEKEKQQLDEFKKMVKGKM